MVDKKKNYLYESPDNGQTVFRHEIGKPEIKELIKVGDDDLEIQDDQYQEWLDAYNGVDVDYQPQYTWTTDNDSIFDEEWEQSFKEEVTWRNMQRVAETNPSLKSLLDQAIMIYNLSKEDQ